jgi:hypothetical protein
MLKKFLQKTGGRLRRNAVVFATSFILLLFVVSVPNAHAASGLIEAGAEFLFKELTKIIYHISLSLGGVFIGIGGLALDLTIQELVIKFGGLFNSAFGAGVVSVWEIIRDVFNIVFIFAFIYIGIRTILNSEDSGTRRAIGNLIVAALFINFSLLICQAIIDFSNVAAVQIYNHIITGGVGASGIDGTFSNEFMEAEQNSISGAFMNVSNMTTFFGDSEALLDDLSGSKLLVYSILMMIFFVLAGFIFLFAAIHIMYRFVALIIYMILSPVLFLGLILPNFEGYTKKWLHGLLKQSFFAPAFLFLIYVSLLSMQTLKGEFVFSAGSYGEVLKGGAMDINEFGIFLFFGITIGFIYASVKVGDMMGIAGAVAGAAYRGTVGAGLNRVVKGIDSLDQKAEAGSKGARFARTIIGGESTRKAVEKASNYGAGGGLGREAVEKQNKERSARATRSNAISKISDTLKSGTTGAKERAIADASNAQLLEMLKDDGGQKLIKENAGKLSTSQFEAVVKSEDITDSYRTELGATRGEQIATRLRTDAQGNVVGLGEVISKADVSELKALGFTTAYDNAGKLSAKQIEDWKDLTPTEKTQLKAKRKSDLETEFDLGTGAPALFTRIKNDEERSKLPDSILTHPAAAIHLNTNVLAKIIDNGGINEDHRKTIRENVLNHHQVMNTGKYQTYLAWFENNNLGQRYPTP